MAARPELGPIPLSPDQRRAFETQGYLVLRGAVPSPRVAALAAALDAVVPEASYAAGFAGRVVEVASISLGSAALREAALDPRFGALAAALLGATRVRLLQDTTFIKPAGGGGGVAWHQDLSYFAFLARPAALTIRVALTPCTRENGCLRVLSGSHRWGLQRDLTFGGQSSVEDSLESVAPSLRGAARDAEVLLELQPGDVSLHHCLTFHSSGPNPAGAPRKTLAMRLVDADVPLHLERLSTAEAKARVPVDAEGLLAESVFPLVYQAEDSR